MAAPTATALRRLDVAPLINTPERATSSDAARETGSFEGPPTRHVTADGERNGGVMVHEENNGTFARFRPHHSAGYFASSAAVASSLTSDSISPTKLGFFETPKAITVTSAPSRAPSHASAPHRATNQTSIGVNIPYAPPAPNPSTEAMYASLDANIFCSPPAPRAWPATSIAGQDGLSWSTELPNMGVNNTSAMSMGPLEPGGSGSQLHAVIAPIPDFSFELDVNLAAQPEPTSEYAEHSSVMGGGGRDVDPSRQQRQRHYKALMQAPRHHEGRPPHQVAAVQTAFYERGGLQAQMDARGTGCDARSCPPPPDAPETVQQPVTSFASTSKAPINPLNAMPGGPSITVSSTLLSHLHPVQAQRAEYMPYFGAHAGWAQAQAPTPSSAPAAAPAPGTTPTASVSADLSIPAGPKEWASEMWGDNPTPDLGRPDAEHTLGMSATPATGVDQSLGPEPALGPPFVSVESTQPVHARWQSSPLGENLHATSLLLPMPTSAPQYTTPQHATSAVPVYTATPPLSHVALAPLHARQQTPPAHASLAHEALQNGMGSSPHTALPSLMAESSGAMACVMSLPDQQVVQHDARQGAQSQPGQVAQNRAQQAWQYQTQQAPQPQRQALSQSQQIQLAQQSEAWKVLQLQTLHERMADRGEAQPQPHASGQVQAHALASTQKQQQQQQQLFPLHYIDEAQRQALQQQYGRAAQRKMPPRLAAQRAQQQQILDVRFPQRQQAELQQTYAFSPALNASPTVPYSPSDQAIEVKPDPDNTDKIVYFNGHVWWFIGWLDPKWLDENMTVEHLKRTLRLHRRTHSVNKPSLIKLLSTWARDKRDKWGLEGVMPRWEPPEESERGSARSRQPKRPRVISQGSFSIDPAIVNLLQGYVVRNEADALAIAEQRGADPELYAWHFRHLASGTLNVKPEIIDISESPAPSATPAFPTAAAQYQHYPAPQQYPPQQHYPPQAQYPGQQQQALTIRMTDPVRITSPAETHATANAEKATQAAQAAVALSVWSLGKKRKASADERPEPPQRARLDIHGALASTPSAYAAPTAGAQGPHSLALPMTMGNGGPPAAIPSHSQYTHAAPMITRMPSLDPSSTSLGSSPFPPTPSPPLRLAAGPQAMPATGQHLPLPNAAPMGLGGPNSHAAIPIQINATPSHQAAASNPHPAIAAPAPNDQDKEEWFGLLRNACYAGLDENDWPVFADNPQGPAYLTRCVLAFKGIIKVQPENQRAHERLQEAENGLRALAQQAQQAQQLSTPVQFPRSALVQDGEQQSGIQPVVSPIPVVHHPSPYLDAEPNPSTFLAVAAPSAGMSTPLPTSRHAASPSVAAPRTSFLALPGISRTPTPGSPATAQPTAPSIDVAAMSRAIVETIKPISAPTGPVTATEPPSALPAMENDEPQELAAHIPVDDNNDSVFDIAQEGSLFYAREEDEHQEQDAPSIAVEQPVLGGVGAPSNEEQQPPTIDADPLLLGADLMPVNSNLYLGIDMSWADIPGMTEFLSSFTEEEVAALA